MYLTSVPKLTSFCLIYSGFKNFRLTININQGYIIKSKLCSSNFSYIMYSTKGVNGNIHFGDSQTKSRKLCCYIMQDDHFHSWFTVEETMLLAAQLKISNDSMNIKEKKMLVSIILY